MLLPLVPDVTHAVPLQYWPEGQLVAVPDVGDGEGDVDGVGVGEVPGITQ